MTNPMRVPLHEVADLQEALDDELYFTMGELSPERERRLDAIAGAAHLKIERIGLFIIEELATAAAIAEEEKRLAARRRARENGAERLKEYLQRQMERLGVRCVTGLLCTVNLQRNSAVAVVPAIAPAGPQKDLFTPVSTARAAHQSRPAPMRRGQHVRVR